MKRIISAALATFLIVQSIAAHAGSPGSPSAAVGGSPTSPAIGNGGGSGGASIGGTISGGTNGSILFVNPSTTIAQNNAGLNWNISANTNLNPSLFADAFLTSDATGGSAGSYLVYHGSDPNNAPAGGLTYSGYLGGMVLVSSNVGTGTPGPLFLCAYSNLFSGLNPSYCVEVGATEGSLTVPGVATLSGGGASTTASLFDNTTEIATDAFANRIGNQLSSFNVYSTNTVLGTSNIGGLVAFGSSGTTFTLPALSSLPITNGGRAFCIYAVAAFNSGSSTLSSSGTDPIQYGPNAVTSITFEPNTFIQFIAGYIPGQGNAWIAVPGNVVGSLGLLGGSTGITYLQAVQTGTASGIWTLPAATDTVVGRATTDTLTNKSIAASEVNSGTLALAQIPTLTPTPSFITNTSTTTYTTPSSGVDTSTVYRITLVGAGGGGGGSATTSLKGAGGGGGGVCVIYQTGLSANTGYTIAVGSGGSGGVGANPGSGGGSSTFNNGTTTYTAGGGSGGSNATATNGGAGGTVSGCTINVPGGQGGPSLTLASAPGSGGGAAGLGWGAGGAGQEGGGNTGLAGANYGGGGGGASSAGSSATGGAGGNGAVLVEIMAR